MKVSSCHRADVIETDKGYECLACYKLCTLVDTPTPMDEVKERAREAIASRIMKSMYVLFGEIEDESEELNPTSSMFAHITANKILDLKLIGNYTLAEILKLADEGRLGRKKHD